MEQSFRPLEKKWYQSFSTAVRHLNFHLARKPLRGPWLTALVVSGGGLSPGPFSGLRAKIGPTLGSAHQFGLELLIENFMKLIRPAYLTLKGDFAESLLEIGSVSKRITYPSVSVFE